MRWQAASWLTRAEREAEEQPECSTPCPSSPARQWPTWAPASSTTPGAFRRVSVTAARCNATDLQPEMLEVLRQAMRQRGIRNVVAVQATPESTGLPEARVELALLVDVYHEVAEPQPFLRQMRRPLTPDGRVVLVEFRAEDQDVPIRAEHKMAADQVIAELVLGGFRLTERYEFLPWQHLLVFVQAR
jgi:ubiquinone/menaquinone biosynthesis C-methylase UbiE